MKKIITLLAFVFLFFELNAAVISWNGSLSTDWAEAGNWNGNQVPGSGDDVLITTGSNHPLISGGTHTVKSISLGNTIGLTIGNGATLNVSGSITYGINIASGSTLTNNGNLNVSSSTDDGIYGSGTIINQSSGIINIEMAGDKGINPSSSSSIFDNAGSINISDSVNDGIGIRGIFTNQSSGIITIERAGNRGLNMFGGNADNSGEINISDSTDDGIYNGGTFTNQSSGTINIDMAGHYGFYNGHLDILDNYGEINVSESTDDGIRNHGTFTNETSGTTIIEEAGNYGLYIFASQFLENSGSINILNSVNNGLHNTGTVTNKNSGIINIEGSNSYGLHMVYNDNLDNEGILSISNCSNTELYNANGNVTNTGSFGIDGTIDGISSFGGTIAPGTSPGTLTIDGNANISSSTLEIEIGGVNSAGVDFDLLAINGLATLNGGTVNISLVNGFIPVEGQSFEFITFTSRSGTFGTVNTPTVNGVSFTMNYAGTSATLVAQCSNTNALSWDGEGGNNLWTNADNWTCNEVPGPNTVVTIDDGTTVTLPAGTHSIKALVLDGNSTLNIANGATLEVDGSTSYGINIVAGSSLTNIGTLTVANSMDDGIYNKGNFSNTGTGNISITNVGDFGFYNEGSTPFVNDGNITVTTSVDDGLYNFGTFTNNGMIEINSPGDFGIYNSTSKTFENFGSISISMSADDGIQSTGSITNKSGATLTITDAMDYGIYIDATGEFTNEGTLDIQNPADEGNRVLGTFTNAASATNTISDCGDIAILLESTGSYSNSGTITITSPVDDGVHNNGTFTNNSGATISITNANTDPEADGIDNNSGAIFNNSGQVSVSGQADRLVEGLGIFNNKVGGELIGSGEIEADYFTAEANSILSPGNSPGAVTYDASEDFSNIIINIEIGGTNAGSEYDQINVSGEATLTGATVNVTFINGYTPTGGETFDIMTFTSNVGNFGAVNIPPVGGILFTTSYTSDKVIVTSALLPVELTGFQVLKSDMTIQLEWQTASELNNEGFEIQRSTDALRWENIGFVNGNGTSSSEHNYSFIDRSPENGINYYRLKQIDFDGRFEYSPINTIEFYGDGVFPFQTFPNPVQNRMNIKIEEELLNSRIELFGSDGQLIDYGTITEITSTINTSYLESGWYLLKISDGIKYYHKKIIKK